MNNNNVTVVEFNCDADEIQYQSNFNRESVAATVIQATGMVEFEDRLRTGVLPGGFWYLLVQNQFQTPTQDIHTLIVMNNRNQDINLFHFNRLLKQGSG